MMRRRVHSDPANIGGDAFTPFQLGASLLAWFDAERPDTITQASTLVSSWTDLITGFSLLQSSAAQKPIYSATSFNGRPGLTFDGIDDLLINTSYPSGWPSSADACWMWGVADQQRANSVAGTNTVLQYGSASTTANTRRITRSVVSGENRGDMMAGTGAGIPTATNTSVVFLGRHVILGKVSGTTVECVMDGVSMTPVAAVPATTAAEAAAIGGAVNGGNFWLGLINTVLITSPLSAAQETAMLAYLARRV